MRRSPARRRRLNNLMILGCIFFIVMFNLPSLVKTYLIEQTESQVITPYLLNPLADLEIIHFPSMSLTKDASGWRLSQSSNIEPNILAERWQNLIGTLVDQATFERLRPQSSGPQTIEVWYQNKEEPHRITLYQTPNFWLMKSWDEKWLAISAEKEYLLP